MTTHRVGADELNRIQILESLALLDTEPEERFDRIVTHARSLFNVPVAFISLLDVARQWFKSVQGLQLENLSREVSFCDYVITVDRHLVVEDLSKDPVLQTNPLVVGTPRARFYAGIPLRVKGQPVGTLAILDAVPRTFAEQELRILETLACWAEAELQQTKLAEVNQTLEAHRARYTALFEESPLAIQVHDLDGELLEKNEGAAFLWSVLGIELRNFLTSSPFTDVDFASHFRAAAAGSSQLVEPFVLESPNGGRTYLRAKLRPLRLGKAVKSVVVSLEDITDTCTFEETQREILRHAAERESRWQKARQDQEDFYAVLSHEMRNPLMGILGIAELVRRDPAAMTSEMVESLHSCAETLSGLIDDTLDIERISQGRLSLQVEPFAPVALLESLVRVNRPIAQAKGLVLTLECRVSHQYVLGDRRRVGQIVANLISNAIKYTSAGAITVVMDGDSESLRFLVSDTGEGIAEDRLEAVFLPFFQVQDGAPDSSRGLGLGLSIIKNLVSLMGGTVTVASTLGQGSTFTVRLPLKRTDPPSPDQAPETPLACRVLVVDDNPVNQKILALQLQSMGCQATIAGDGLEALEALGRQQFDLILMDCQMPRLDGFEATRRVRENAGLYGCPVIVALTGSTKEQARDRCMEAGMDDYLKKPIRHQDLKMALERNLRKSPSVSDL